MSHVALKTTVSDYLPGRMYHITYTGVARQHDKYQTLRRAVLEGIEHVLETDHEYQMALSSGARELRDWVIGGATGFTCEHMPWQVSVPQELYRMFIYVLRAPQSEAGDSAYASIRRYGTWV